LKLIRSADFSLQLYIKHFIHQQNRIFSFAI
jgi:hypothetical protein